MKAAAAAEVSQMREAVRWLAGSRHWVGTGQGQAAPAVPQAGGVHGRKHVSAPPPLRAPHRGVLGGALALKLRQQLCRGRGRGEGVAVHGEKA